MLSRAARSIVLAKPWLFPGSALDLAFSAGTGIPGYNLGAVNGQQVGTATSQLTLTRTTTKYVGWNDGHYSSVASGAFAISDKGLLIEEARTNDALWSRDMTNAVWVKTNVTAAQTAVGADGTANSATQLTATAGNATVLQTIVLGSSADTYSAVIQRVSGSGNIQTTADGVTYTTVALTTAYTQFSVTQTLANPVFGIRIVTSGDVINVDFSQLEPGGFATSPIATTSAAATRNADLVSVNNFGLFANTGGSAFVEWNEIIGPIAASGRIFAAGSSTTNVMTITRAISNKVNMQITSGGASVNHLTANAVVAGIIYRAAGAFAAGDGALATSASLNAGIITGAPVIPAGATTSVTIGQMVDNSSFLDGYVRRLAWFPSRLPNTTLLAWAQGTVGP